MQPADLKPVISIQGLSKAYPFGDSPLGHLRDLFGFGRQLSTESAGDRFWALRDISFSVEKGEAFGIIGQNGSGKSTLLQIVAGIMRPTSGTVEIHGRVSALLELGSGFNPEFTGRENVFLNASILGFTRRETESKFDDIASFADIGEFIHQPVKTYSTGMVLRLAFAVSVYVEPEILIVDEALAVGDIAFRQRCLRRIHDLRARGVTIMFVSHDSGDIRALCNRALWLDHGVAREIGPADEVVTKYLSAMVQKNESDIRQMGSAPSSPEAALPRRLQHAPEVIRGFSGTHRYGDMRAKILGAAAVNESGEPVEFITAGSKIVFRISIEVAEELPSPIAGFLVRNSSGIILFGTNTARENYSLPFMTPGEIHTIDFHWTPIEFATGRYTVSVAVSSGTMDEFAVCDYIEDAISLAVPESDPPIQGYFRMPCRSVTVHRFRGGNSIEGAL